MRRECRERFSRHRLQRKPQVNDPGMHHGTCVTHVPWCMSGSLTSGGGENVSDIPGVCATRNFTYLARGPYHHSRDRLQWSFWAWVQPRSPHYDVIKYWPFVQEIHRSQVNSPPKGQWRRTLTLSLISAWTNGWINNRDIGDLRRHRAHYDVTAMHRQNGPCVL